MPHDSGILLKVWGNWNSTRPCLSNRTNSQNQPVLSILHRPDEFLRSTGAIPCQRFVRISGILDLQFR